MRVPRPIVSALRRGMLFSVGSLIILQEKTEAFVQEAIQRGHEAQTEGKKLVQDMRSERGVKRAKGKPKGVPGEKQIREALERLDVPSRDDIKKLHQQIEMLSERIAEFKSVR